MGERFLVLGAAGQDGTLAGLHLDSRGEEVHASFRTNPNGQHALVRALPADRVHVVDLLDRRGLIELLERVQPTRILNLAGESNVRASWDHPARTFAVNTVGALNVLEAVIETGLAETVRVYQAISSEVFGAPSVSPQDEATPMEPVTPYGASKAAARQSGAMFRHREDLWVANGILYNHESVFRPETYVVRHVTASVARISLGMQTQLEIGNLDSRRDWGAASEYVDGMLRMLEHHEPEDFVLATGTSRSVGDLCRLAFDAVGIDGWESYTVVRTERLRQVEPVALVGDASKAADLLGWAPQTPFAKLVSDLVQHDVDRLSKESQPLEHE